MARGGSPLFMVVLVGAVMCPPLALNMFMPSLPGMIAVFGTDLATAQLALSLYLVGIAAGQLVHGPLSDRYGRRPVLMGSTVIYVVGSLACYFAPSIEALLAGRLVQAFGGCAGMVMGRAVLRDLYDRDEAASKLGYITMAMALAPAVAPVIGGYLDLAFGWRAGFAVVAGFGLGVLGLTWLILSETNHSRTSTVRLGAVIGGFGGLIVNRTYVGYLGCVAFTSGAFFAFLGGAPYVSVAILGASPAEYGVWFLCISIGYMFGNFLAGRYARTLGVDRLVAIGGWWAIASTTGGLIAALLLPFGMLTMFGAMGLCSIGNGMNQAAAISGAVSVDPRRAGSAAGLLGCVQMGLGGLLSYGLGHVLTDSAMPLMWMMCLCSWAAQGAFMLVWFGRGAPGAARASAD